jgi:general secretion pathway protein D
MLFFVKLRKMRFLSPTKVLSLIFSFAICVLPFYSSIAQERVSMNFKDIDILDLVRLISEWSGKNYLLDQRIRGKVTIISPRPVTKREALEIFNSILYANDLAQVEVGNIVKIVPAAEARQSPIKTVIKEKKLLPSEEYVTLVLTPRFANADQVAGVLRNLLSRNAFLQTYMPTNTIILIETKANIERLTQILDEIDVPPPLTTEMIKLKYSIAQDVVNILTQIIPSIPRVAVSPQQQPKVIAEPRTNSIIIVAQPDDIEYLKKVVEKVDVQEERGEVNVVYLKYARAEEVSSILQNIVGGGLRQQPGPQVVQAPVRIAADKSTNSLIIIASPPDFEKIKDIISKIDVERRQVFVSAVIMEISSSRLTQYGLSFLGGKDISVRTDGTTGKGIAVLGESVGAPLPFQIVDPKNIANISGLLFGFSLPPASVEVGGQTISLSPLAAILNTLATDTQVDILSTPHILTLDNKEAEIRVATNVPFPTGQIITAAGPGGAAVPTITIQRQDIGIILKITPHVIKEEKKLSLDISVEISDVAEEPPPGLAVQQLGIATIKRTSTTSILVEDGQTAVIGGLMRTRSSLSRAKVPILGDIPVLGFLFRSSQKRVQKSNLLIFITPKIIWSAGEIEDIKSKKIQENIKMRKDEGME